MWNRQEWLKAVKRFVHRENSLGSVVNHFVLTVVYDQSMEKALEAGNYDRINDITSENLPPTRCGTESVDVRIVHFKRTPPFNKKTITFDQIPAELDKLGLRPGTIEVLLALGAEHPDLQRKFSIWALGSVWKDGGRSFIPVLWSVGHERIAGFEPWGIWGGWFECWCLAVPK